MSIESVAILSPGDMGHAIGQLLKENELRVLTCLTGRSDRTKQLSEQAGITDVPNMNELVQQADVLMSVTVSEAVPGLCREIADAVKATATGPDPSVQAMTQERLEELRSLGYVR